MMSLPITENHDAEQNFKAWRNTEKVYKKVGYQDVYMILDKFCVNFTCVGKRERRMRLI